MEVARAVLAVVLPACLVGGCSEQRPALEPPAASPSRASTSASPTPTAAGATPAVELPAGALRALVPGPQEVPAGLLPLLQTSGPRDATTVAAFSADPDAAAAGLARNGFTDAYVAQYAAPSDPRALTVVVVRFATAEGARADLASDVAAGTGAAVDVGGTIGAASEVRRLPLPDDPAVELVTVRFVAGSTTWLLAWRAPRPADEQVPVDLARMLATRA